MTVRVEYAVYDRQGRKRGSYTERRDAEAHAHRIGGKMVPETYTRI